MARGSDTIYAVMYAGADRVEPRQGFISRVTLEAWLKEQPSEDLIWLHIYEFHLIGGECPKHKFPSDFIGNHSGH